MTTAHGILQRAEGKAAAVATPAPPDIAKVAKPAPGASPVGAFAFMEGDDGTQAWLVKDGDQTVGYLRDADQPDRAIEIEDAQAWAKIVDQLGLHEQPVPAEDPTAPAEPPQDPAQPPADAAAPDAQTPAAPAAGADGSAPPADDQQAAPPAPPKQQTKATPAGRVETPTDHEEQTGIMVAFIVPEGDARDMVLDLDTALPWTELHLTLAYLGTTDEVDDEGEFYANVLEALRDVAGEYEPLSGTVSGIGRFNADGDADAFVYLYDSPDLPELRQAIVEALEEQGIDVNREHGFQPHITLCYLKQGEDAPIRRAESKVLAFDALTFAFGDQRLNIRLGGTSPGEEDDDAYMYELGANGRRVDSTAPAAMPEQVKALPPQFAKNGKKKVGKKGGPPLAAGSFVAWGNQRGKIDLIVTNGKVPGVEEDITGTASSPAARVSVMVPGPGGKLKATGKKVGVSVSSLKRSAPFAFGGKKDLDLTDPEAALVGVLTGYYEAHDGTSPIVDPLAVKTVYERGLVSWPGEHTGVPNEAWALGRTKAFLAVAGGLEVKDYALDRDLLPEGHPLAVKAVPMLTVRTNDTGEIEKKAAVTVAKGEHLDRATLDDVLAGLRSALS